MSIEYDDKLRPVIFIGDGDVLTGATAVPGAVRFWMAPRKLDDGLVTNEIAPRAVSNPPGDEAVTVYFVSKIALDRFIEMLTKVRDKAFPPPPPEPQTGPPMWITPEMFEEGWSELIDGATVVRKWTESDVIRRDESGNYLVRTKKLPD